jgi:hypothetical protein
MIGMKRGVVSYLVATFSLSAVAPSQAQFPTPSTKYLALPADARAGYVLGSYEALHAGGMVTCDGKTATVNNVQSLMEDLLNNPGSGWQDKDAQTLLLSAMMRLGCRRGSGR